MRWNPSISEQFPIKVTFLAMAAIILYLLLTRSSKKCAGMHPPTLKCPDCPSCPIASETAPTVCPLPPPCPDTECPSCPTFSSAMCPTPPPCPSPPPCPACPQAGQSSAQTNPSSTTFGSLGRNLEF